MARIWVHSEGGGPRSEEIGDGLLIGRGSHCDLVLDDETVSTDHAELTRRGASYLIADLGSKNGTIVNGRRIEKQTRLASRDIITISPFRLELDLPEVIKTTPRESITVELGDDERAVAQALVAPYRTVGTLAGRPATRREIAEALHLSDSTVKRRLESLALKLEVVDQPRGDRMRMIADRVMALGLDRR